MSKKLFLNTFYLSGSNILVKVLYFGLIFLIIDAIGADDYGRYAIALNYISLFSLVTVMGFDIVLVKEGAAKNKEELQELQNNFFPVRFYWSLIIFLISLITLLFTNYESDVKNLIIILSPIIFLGGTITSGLSEHYSIVVRSLQKMKYIAYQNILRIFSIILLSSLLLILDKMSLINFCLIISLISVFNLFLNYYYSEKKIKNKFSFRIDLNLIRSYYKSIITFGIVSLLYGVGGLLDIFIISSYLEAELIGYYSLALSFIAIISNFISSFQLSIYPYISNSNSPHKNNLLKSYLFVLSLIIMFNLIIFPIIINISKFIIGDKYQITISLIAIFIWVLPLRVIQSWININLDLDNKFNLKLFLSSVNIISLLCTLKYSILTFGVNGVIYSIMFSISLMIFSYILLIFIKKLKHGK